MSRTNIAMFEPTTALSDSQDALRTTIAIVGCGPRGLYCLEKMVSKAKKQGAPPLRVLIFEPSQFPGAGKVYDPRQPRYLRMNFAARHIDAWSCGQSGLRERLDLVGWLARCGATCDPNAFVPRSVVGEYLHDCFQTVVQEAGANISITLHQNHVDAILRDQRKWRLNSGEHSWLVDDIIVTVGHEGWRPGGKEIPVFPVEQLSEAAVPPGSAVAVRGFALTWIDAALTLTEGRGGRFEQQASRWQYRASGREPMVLVPFSRTGRPMLAKPDETRFPHPKSLQSVWQSGHKLIDRLKRPLKPDGIAQMWTTICRHAALALRTVLPNAGGLPDETQIAAWFDRWCKGPMTNYSAVNLMRQSYAVATAQTSPDIAWALAATWRGVYPAVVRCVSHAGLTVEAWTSFRIIAVEMERIAFGPPAENLGRTLALIDAGLVDIAMLTAELTNNDGKLALVTDQDTKSVDQCINAVLPSPQSIDPNGPLQGLLQQQKIQRDLSGGIAVDSHARPLVNDEVSVDGLRILGRCTEGCVLGNDTLCRNLHGHLDRCVTELVHRAEKRLAAS